MPTPVQLDANTSPIGLPIQVVCVYSWLSNPHRPGYPIGYPTGKPTGYPTRIDLASQLDIQLKITTQKRTQNPINRYGFFWVFLSLAIFGVKSLFQTQNTINILGFFSCFRARELYYIIFIITRRMGRADARPFTVLLNM